MGIGTLKYFNPSVTELITESVDETRWWQIVNLIVRFMDSIAIKEVHAKFGFIMDRDEDGLEQEPDRDVTVQELTQFISDNLTKGTIEMKGPSDFVFESVDRRLLVMLCNDVDVHIASPDTRVVDDLGREIKSLGIKVYDNDGNLI
jgi:hypothetical protein